jgi:hypothetical protein
VEDVELIAIGVLVAVALSLVEMQYATPRRVFMGLGVVLGAAGALYVLRLSITANGAVFLQADIGAFLGVRMMDTWLDDGLLRS